MDSNGFSSRPAYNYNRYEGTSRRRTGGIIAGVLRIIIGALALAAGIAAGILRWLVDQQRLLGWKRFLTRAAGITGLVAILYFGFLWFTLPDVSDPTNLLAAQSTVITDRNGVELYRLYGEQDRTYVSGTDIADAMKKATIAIEDERFFNHGCIEFRSIFRALFARFTGRSVTGGASTLTQQLARNSLISSERTVTRKIREIMLACQLERVYDKDKLLELYLNWIPFGQNAYGIEQASHRYFGIAARQLSVGQAAVLASIPQRPTYFNPYGAHARTQVTAAGLKRIASGKVKTAADIPDSEIQIGLIGNEVGSGAVKIYVGGRSDQVLRNMQNLGFISEQQRQEAIRELKTTAFKPTRENIRAPHFVLWVKDQVERLLEKQAEKGLLEQGGLTIQTTLDWKLQQQAETAVASRAANNEKLYNARNAALIALDPKTRQVLAYVGNNDFGKDEKEAKIDMVQAPRQPGSSFKPFVYAASFSKGYAPATILFDTPTKFGTDEPQNFDGGFWGLMSARQALGASRNIPAIKAFFLAGGEKPILDLTESMGVPSPKLRKQQITQKRPFDYGWPLAIGAAETPLIEMANGYATFADGGLAKTPVTILKITDKRGAILPLSLPDPQDPGTPALDPRIAYQITSVLSDASVRPGEFWQNALSIPGFQAAAKTGTSNKCLDRNEKDGVCKNRKPDNVWTIGYTPDLVTGVWVGNANSEALTDKADGLNVAAPIWKDFMTRALKVVQVNATDFPVPQGVVQMQVSGLSGDLPAECTPVYLRRPEVFLAERAPTQPDRSCITMTVDRVTGLLPSDNCPSDAQVTRSFFIPTSIQAERWPSWEEGLQKWVHGTGSRLPLPLPPVAKCDVSKTPGRLLKPQVEFLEPLDGGTVSYPAFQPKISYGGGTVASGVTFLLDGKTVAELSRPPYKPVIRVPRSIPKEGVHTLEVIFTDAYYNTAKASVTIRFGGEASGPSVRLLFPAPGTKLARGSGVTMQADASSPAGVKYVEFYVDGTLLTRKPQEPYVFEYPLNLPAGLHTFRVIAVDTAGKAAEDEVQATVE